MREHTLICIISQQYFSRESSLSQLGCFYGPTRSFRPSGYGGSCQSNLHYLLHHTDVRACRTQKLIEQRKLVNQKVIFHIVLSEKILKLKKNLCHQRGKDDNSCKGITKKQTSSYSSKINDVLIKLVGNSKINK